MTHHTTTLVPVGSSLVQIIWNKLHKNPTRANELAKELGLRTSEVTRFLLYMASGKSYYWTICLEKGRPGPGGAGLWVAGPPNPMRRIKVRRN